MEHILISPGKLKLMLTRDDLEHYELDRAAENETASSRLAFRTLLEDAGRLTGFEAGDDKLFIQLYPSKDGGAEIYITKLGRQIKDVCCNNGCEPGGGIPEHIRLTRIGSFGTVGELLECCAHIRGCCESASSSAYSDGKRYYLVISELISYGDYLARDARELCSRINESRCAKQTSEKPMFEREGTMRIEAAFGEYGKNIRNMAVLSYIKEHCYTFCEKGAVKTLADMV